MARIERMERRLQMVKKEGTESRPSRRKEPDAETASTDDVQQSEGRVQTPKQTYFGRGGKNLKRYEHEQGV